MAKLSLVDNVYLNQRIIEPPDGTAYEIVRDDTRDVESLVASLSTRGYTEKQIAMMTPNDMIFALRVAYDVQI